MSYRDSFWADQDQLTASLYRASKLEYRPQPVVGPTTPMHHDEMLFNTPNITANQSSNANESFSWDELDSIQTDPDMSIQRTIPQLPSRSINSPMTDQSSPLRVDESSIIQDFSMVDDTPKKHERVLPKPVVTTVMLQKPMKKVTELPPPPITSPSSRPIKRTAKEAPAEPPSKPFKRRKEAPIEILDDSPSASPIEEFAKPRNPPRTRPSTPTPKSGSSLTKRKSSFKAPSVLHLPGGVTIMSSPQRSKSNTDPPLKKRSQSKSTKLTPSTDTQSTKKMWVGDRSKNGRPHGVSCHKYIQYVNDGVLEVPQGPRKGSFETSEHMKGMIIFVIHSCGETLVGMTDSVYELVNELYRHGATLLSKFDHTNPTATHIVCLSNDLKKALHQLKISKITNLPPGIPTLNKEWMRRVTKGQGEGRWSDYAAFPQRKNVPQPNADEEKSANKEKPLSLKERQELARAKARARYGAQKRDTSAVELSSEGVDSEDEEQTRMDREEARLQALQFSSPVKQLLKKERRESRGESSVVKQPLVDDPLAAFYTKARVAALQTIGRHGETEDDDAFDSEVEDSVAPSEGKGKQKASSWTVDQKPTGTTTKCANHDIIEKLEILMKLHESKPTQDDKWRAYSYSKAIRALKAYPARIASLKEAQAIYGIGEKTGKKIMEIIETGDLRRIAHETTEDVLVTRIFTGIYGVGSATAYQWYMQGYRTLEDVQKHKKRIGLSRAQEIGLANYDDINTRMPREEAGELFELIKPVALRFDNRLDVQIMGSYRRGKSTCGDIDIMITRDTSDGRTHAGALRYLLKALHDKGIITDDLATPDNSDDEECIYRGLCRLPHREGSRKRRIDFLCIPWISRGAALIYYTGDDIFNRAMRWKANKMGYSLNQRGLWTDVVRDPRNRQKKLSQGTILASSTEEEIFKILEVPWQEPYERVRNLE